MRSRRTGDDLYCGRALTELPSSPTVRLKPISHSPSLPSDDTAQRIPDAVGVSRLSFIEQPGRRSQRTPDPRPSVPSRRSLFAASQAKHPLRLAANRKCGRVTPRCAQSLLSFARSASCVRFAADNQTLTYGARTSTITLPQAFYGVGHDVIDLPTGAVKSRFLLTTAGGEIRAVSVRERTRRSPPTRP